jgi:hypothetical protein
MTTSWIAAICEVSGQVFLTKDEKRSSEKTTSKFEWKIGRKSFILKRHFAERDVQVGKTQITSKRKPAVPVILTGPVLDSSARGAGGAGKKPVLTIALIFCLLAFCVGFLLSRSRSLPDDPEGKNSATIQKSASESMDLTSLPASSAAPTPASISVRQENQLPASSGMQPVVGEGLSSAPTISVVPPLSETLEVIGRSQGGILPDHSGNPPGSIVIHGKTNLSAPPTAGTFVPKMVPPVPSSTATELAAEKAGEAAKRAETVKKAEDAKEASATGKAEVAKNAEEAKAAKAAEAAKRAEEAKEAKAAKAAEAAKRAEEAKAAKAAEAAKRAEEAKEVKAAKKVEAAKRVEADRAAKLPIKAQVITNGMINYDSQVAQGLSRDGVLASAHSPGVVEFPAGPIAPMTGRTPVVPSAHSALKVPVDRNLPSFVIKTVGGQRPAIMKGPTGGGGSVIVTYPDAAADSSIVKYPATLIKTKAVRCFSRGKVVSREKPLLSAKWDSLAQKLALRVPGSQETEFAPEKSSRPTGPMAEVPAPTTTVRFTSFVPASPRDDGHSKATGLANVIDIPSLRKKSRMLVGLRSVLQADGWKITWINSRKGVVCRRDSGDILNVIPGSRRASFNGRAVFAPVSATIGRGGQMFVPLEFLNTILAGRLSMVEEKTSGEVKIRLAVRSGGGAIPTRMVADEPSAQGSLDLSGVPTIRRGGEVLVSLRPVLEADGWSVHWEGSKRGVLCRKGRAELRIYAGQAEIRLNNQVLPESTPPVLFRGTLYVAKGLVDHLHKAVPIQVSWRARSDQAIL